MTFFLRQCSGLSLTSFIKYEPNQMFERIHASTIEKYMKYKRIFGFYDENYKGCQEIQLH